MARKGDQRRTDPLVAELRRIRLARGFSQAQMGQLTGIHSSTIAGCELGRSNPSLGTVRAWADGLGVGLAVVDPQRSEGAAPVRRRTIREVLHREVT
jgi:transcriptional regulator with XRE-family HTH domain